MQEVTASHWVAGSSIYHRWVKKRRLTTGREPVSQSLSHQSWDAKYLSRAELDFSWAGTEKYLRRVELSQENLHFSLVIKCLFYRGRQLNAVIKLVSSLVTQVWAYYLYLWTLWRYTNAVIIIIITFSAVQVSSH